MNPEYLNVLRCLQAINNSHYLFYYCEKDIFVDIRMQKVEELSSEGINIYIKMQNVKNEEKCQSCGVVVNSLVGCRSF